MDKVCLATMNLISAEICGKDVDADLIKSLNDDELKALYALSVVPVTFKTASKSDAVS